MERKNVCKPPEYTMDDVAEFFESEKTRALRVSEIEAIMGGDYDLDRLRELVEADRDGLCVVLPCKVGDKMQYIDSDESIGSETVEKIVVEVETDMNQNEKSEFPARLRKLREERRQSRVVVSELCGLDRDAVRSYEREERSPNVKALIALADYFEVSLDYLTGRTNFR